MNHSLTFYQALARVVWPKSYLGKMHLIAFLGVHIPLLSIITYAALVALHWSTTLPVIVIGVVWVMRNAMRPK